jgi:hypothetical protein
MVEIKVDITELKKEGDETIQELAGFLKEKTGADVDTTTSEMTVKSDKVDISRNYMRVLLRKFLHRVELKEYFKVIGGREGLLVIKEKKVEEEEE